MNVMKAMYLSAALFFLAVTAMAQTNPSDQTVLPGLEKKSLITWNKQPIKQGFNLPVQGIIKLPQDNMPCFVPDVSSVVVMPTLRTVSPYQSIPNPYFKFNSSRESTANSLPR